MIDNFKKNIIKQKSNILYTMKEYRTYISLAQEIYISNDDY